jgi:phage antirepressor YoqD-like protein
MDHKQASSPELSTSNLAKQLKLSTKDMFQLLVDTGLIIRNGDTWDLTPREITRWGL